MLRRFITTVIINTDPMVMTFSMTKSSILWYTMVMTAIMTIAISIITAIEVVVSLVAGQATFIMLGYCPC